MTFPAHVFRMYDIRGKAGEDLSEEFSYHLGNAFARLLLPGVTKNVAVGRDCRLTSEAYAESLIEGLRHAGVNVLDLGMIPTPLLYFSLFRRQIGGGIMVTGSHNPPEDNGFKLSLGHSSLFGDSIQKLKLLMGEKPLKSSPGKRTFEDIKDEYLFFLEKDISLARPLNVVIDAGNGATSKVAPLLFSNIGAVCHTLFCEPDGNFPNHHPDPTQPENLRSLSDEVTSQNADIGIAFDGDGDRIGVIDKKGRIYWGDELLILFARDVLAKTPGAKIISEVKASQRLFQDISRHGGNPIMWKTGHSLIKAKMKETGALLAGEMSGHIFFADRYFGYDDAMYAGARLVEFLSHHSQSIEELLSDLSPSYLTPELRIPCRDQMKFEVVQNVKKHFSLKYPCIDIDGVRINFPDGWGLVRASNTQPVLVLRFEATSEEKLHAIRSEVEEVVTHASGE
ncbi:MAG TPA: phosphomannomutase/phosphoglucomutase [Bdellovibrionota bacterium]|nr:phosphomannomutase/phosphoglucomutase [Bdellovibrionota bacterium]